jgi:ABC-type bacteriocin/lantibiotic exporter with double-glycine peptidase domain
MLQCGLHLPVKWHQDNHSGAIINRARKAYEALKLFFQDGFMFFHSFAKFIFSFAAILYFSPLFGLISAILGIFMIWLIYTFDKPLIKNLNATNEKEHVVSSTLFNCLSNINTVITLRLEKQREKSLLQKVKKDRSRRNLDHLKQNSPQFQELWKHQEDHKKKFPPDDILSWS